MSERLPRIALVVFVLGLAVHNLVMAELWDVGIRGASLDVVAAWKDVLLAAALVVALLAAGKLPSWLWADRLALAYAALVLLYWLLPQGWLGDGSRHAEGTAPRRPPRSDSGRGVLPRASARPHAGRVAPSLAGVRRSRRRRDRVGPRRRLSRPTAVVARLGSAGLVRGAARSRLQRRRSPGCPRTGFSTPATSRTPSAEWGRPSSAHSRPRTCS